MKILYTFIALIILTFSAESVSPIQYYSTTDSSPQYQELTAEVNNKVFELISLKDELCLNIVAKGDFNKNGNEDVLIEIVNGCGGNCCGKSYKVFSFNNHYFIPSKTVGYDWDGIVVKKQESGYQFIIETINEGIGNTEICSNKIETFELNDYDLELIEVTKENKINSLLEITGESFIGKEDERLILKYDLDGDGIADTIFCTYWERWGRLTEWEIKFSNGINYIGNSNPKRIGILSSRTNNVNDLVIECEEILRWNGLAYE